MMADERRRRAESERASTATGRAPSAQPDDEKIRHRAYEIYERRGGEPGHDWDDWLEAERELRPTREDE
jgi:Protein of unknown function (DUF2934)